jgi:Fur family ferric uptake transcriptional regulator
VDAALRASEGFLTAQDLHAEMRRHGDRIGLTTVYRHLKMLVETGAVDVVHRADGEAQYRLCGPRDVPPAASVDHHHHLVCRVCGRAVEVAGPQVERWAEEMAAAHGYTEITHTLEVFGLCPEHSAPAR